ncbi:unnamed protein product [Cyclocybe aegerita]|uniref:Uncharacterized protein n=1 Tax=Cyclocybe aegerita TaxID=1973307 RepID=A0A8S0WIA3_CYCAE|nr:unnamed protein product [Cyclocybe aegerita]
MLLRRSSVKVGSLAYRPDVIKRSTTTKAFRIITTRKSNKIMSQTEIPTEQTTTIATGYVVGGGNVDDKGSTTAVVSVEETRTTTAISASVATAPEKTTIIDDSMYGKEESDSDDEAPPTWDGGLPRAKIRAPTVGGDKKDDKKGGKDEKKDNQGGKNDEGSQTGDVKYKALRRRSIPNSSLTMPGASDITVIQTTTTVTTADVVEAATVDEKRPNVVGGAVFTSETTTIVATSALVEIPEQTTPISGPNSDEGESDDEEPVWLGGMPRGKLAQNAVGPRSNKKGDKKDDKKDDKKGDKRDDKKGASGKGSNK